MIIDPISAGIAGVSTALNLFGAGQQNAAAQQDYLNQSTFQRVTDRFARWQAGQNQRFSDANARYQFWGQQVQYQQQLGYVHQLQSFELAKQINQANVVRDSRAAAGAEFIGNSQAASNRLQEVAMQAAVAQQQYGWRALQARASVQAMDAEGLSVDRLIDNYAKQAGDYNTIAKINEGLIRNQFNREQTAMVGRYLSEWNSQQFYTPTTYIEPMEPFAPLPALMQPAAPSMTGTGPSNGAAGLRIGSALLGGVDTYMNSAGRLKRAAEPRGGTIPTAGIG
jgi:hypothetical protein